MAKTLRFYAGLVVVTVLILFVVYWNWNTRLRFYFAPDRDSHYQCTHQEPYPTQNDKHSVAKQGHFQFPPVSINHPSPVSSVWTRVSDSTLAYRVAHYDSRTISWGGPVLIALLLHDEHMADKPDLYAKIVYQGGIETCLETKGSWKNIRKPKDAREHVEGYIVLYSVKHRPVSTLLCLKSDCSKCSSHLSVYWEERVKKLDFAVCLYQPLFQICDHERVIAWIETNRALGAQKITVYYQESYKNVRESIQQYVDEGFVEAFSWHQNFTRLTDNCFGQALVAFDCLYRYMHRTNYLAMFDLDELLVPLKSPTWHGLIKELDEPGVSSFRFCLSYFHDVGNVMSVDLLADISTKNTCDAIRDIPVMFKRTMRTANVDCTIHKWKNIMKPLAMRYPEVHHVVSADGYEMMTVPINVGLLYHYRDNDYWKNEASVEDLTMSKYFDGVVSRSLEKFCP